MNRNTFRIATIIACCFGALFALTGCEALGLSLTSQGIQGNSHTLILLLIVVIILIVVVQRLLER